MTEKKANVGGANQTHKSAPSAKGKRQVHSASRPWPAWHASLRNFRNPSSWRAMWQIANTLLPYLALWLVTIWSIKQDYPLTVTIALIVLASAFLVRLFILFHDCVHGSLFPSKTANAFFGHLLGLLTFTPFDDWRFSHLRHHARYADLDARGVGDIWTMTRREYEDSSKTVKRWYRVYRNPFILIGFGAVFTFILQFRLPSRSSTRKEHMSVLFTNLLIIVIMLVVARFIGWQTYLLIQLPLIFLAGAAGIWLFYVQHQFEGGYWAHKDEWDALRAAMEGSSFYKLPTLLRWFTGNIGYHHVHHLSARIPNYRLKECYDSIPELQDKKPLTIWKSISCIGLKLWDEDRKQLVGFPHPPDH